jgi:hypothetical protein
MRLELIISLCNLGAIGKFLAIGRADTGLYARGVADFRFNSTYLEANF